MLKQKVMLFVENRSGALSLSFKYIEKQKENKNQRKETRLNDDGDVDNKKESQDMIDAWMTV